MDRLLAAIQDDDLPTVKKRLMQDPGLATELIPDETLYESQIFHWIYVEDTALHLAAAGYRCEIVEVLLAADADPNAAANRRRSTPFHYAADGFITGPAWNPQLQVTTLRLLLAAGARMNAQDKNGASALHRAVRTRSAAAVRFLLESGADPELKNKPGSTPFHLAVQNTGRGGSGAEAAHAAQQEIIRTFREFGVSSSLKDGKGKSVLDCARSDWIRELLTSARTDPS